ncbi:MAG TPA: SagB/ThcOx family dehydrogenase [Methylomirabilota bacterium]|nr:SagB/ThcOx family dehydrogenase [Methylomirabilota bacterium]
MRRSGHALDWEIKPLPFKVYPAIEPIRLPTALPSLATDTFAALAGNGPIPGPAPLDLERLAALLFFSAGVTRVKTYPGGGRVHFRAAPSTGALYQTEAYVVAGDVRGLEAGVYHFSPGDFSLRRLRAGDFRGALAEAAADEAIAEAPASIVLSAIYWRNTWKYQARGYRHLFWDSGTLLAQLLATARALGVAAHLVTGFVDAAVNALLGLDARREGALVIAPVGAGGRPAGAAPPVAPLDPEVIPLSAREVDYPLLRRAYEDSSLEDAAEVIEWRARGRDAGRENVAMQDLTPLAAARAEAGPGLGETIARRASTRAFSGEAIPAQALSDALYHATRGFAADVPDRLVDLYVNVHAVTGIEPGAYVYDRDAHALGRLRAGDVRAESTFLCLEQALGGTSSATVFFLSPLEQVLARWGNRGYRLANLEAGLIGGRLYLAAYAQRFGATGLTFYDRPVVEFFSPHAAGKDALFVTALGRSVRATGPGGPAVRVKGPAWKQASRRLTREGEGGRRP